MRTIDADAALKALRKCQTYLYDARDPELKIELSSAEAAIKELPTIQPEKAQLSCEGTTSDLISRQAAIDALKGHRALYCDNTPETFSKLSYVEKSRVDELDTAIATLVNLPTAQPEPPWIPVSERLPRDGSWNIFTDGKNISVERYKADAIDHFFPNGRWFELNDVIAWMPLPEAYKPNK